MADRRVAVASVMLGAVVCLGSTAVAPSYAATETEHGTEAQVDVNPDTENPCTGALGELVDDERDSWSVAMRGDGSFTARGHAVVHVTFTPYDDGAERYAGHEVFSSVEHVSRGADGFRSSQRVRMRGSAGGVLTFVERAHLTIRPDGEVVVDRQSSALSCG